MTVAPDIPWLDRMEQGERFDPTLLLSELASQSDPGVGRTDLPQVPQTPFLMETKGSSWTGA